MLASTVTVIRNCIETHVVVEFVSRNGVRHVVDVLLRERRTEKGDHKIVTIYNQIFASLGDAIPASTMTRTLITDSIKVTSEPGSRLEDVFISLVDGETIRRLQ